MLRLATVDDIPALHDLIRESVHGLQSGHYSAAQRDASLGTVFGVDRQLILDETYFVVESVGRRAACGGWSRRQTLFGANGADASALDPADDAARIRAFFVPPDYARRGLATQVLAGCECAAFAAGFTRLELVATLTGEPFHGGMAFQPLKLLSSSRRWRYASRHADGKSACKQSGRSPRRPDFTWNFKWMND